MITFALWQIWFAGCVFFALAVLCCCLCYGAGWRAAMRYSIRSIKTLHDQNGSLFRQLDLAKRRAPRL